MLDPEEFLWNLLCYKSVEIQGCEQNVLAVLPTLVSLLLTSVIEMTERSCMKDLLDERKPSLDYHVKDIKRRRFHTL